MWREGLFYKLLKAGVRENALNVIENMYRLQVRMLCQNIRGKN